MKTYKIVEYVDGNGEQYFEVHVNTPWILGDRWKPLMDWSHRGPYKVILRFNNLKQAQYAVKALQIKKTIVEEGELIDE